MTPDDIWIDDLALLRSNGEPEDGNTRTMTEEDYLEIFKRLDREESQLYTRMPGSSRVRTRYEIRVEREATKQSYRRWKAEAIRQDIAAGKPLPNPKVIDYLGDQELRKFWQEEAARRNRDLYPWRRPDDVRKEPVPVPAKPPTNSPDLRDDEFRKAMMMLAKESLEAYMIPANVVFTTKPDPSVPPQEFMQVLQRVPYDQREKELMAVIDQLQKKMIQQDETLKAIAQPPFARGTVVKARTKGNYAMVSVNGQIMELSLPPDVAKEVTVGTQLRMNVKTGAVVDIVEGEPSGHIVTVIRILDKESIEVEFMGGPRAVTCSFLPAPTKGDRVMVNDGVHVVLKCLGKLEDVYTVEDAVNVPWEAIGGQKTAKTEMIEAIEGPVKHAEIFKAYGKQPVKGILLYGPPGCGKTMLAKAAATSLANLYGAKSSSGFIYVKGPEILNKYVGESESSVRNLFKRAREHKRKHGYPAVLFIDEADAILGTRGELNFGMERTIVPAFLAEMDGFDKDGPLVLLATNRSDQLDPAIIRDGRVDRKIEVQRPGLEDSTEIFKMYLKDKPIGEFCTNDEFAQVFAMKLFVSEELKKRVSGSLIAGVVDQAISSAMRRDIDAKSEKVSGLSEQDIDNAIKATELANKHVSR